MFNKEDKNPSHYEIILSITQVRFERDTKVIESLIDEITLDLAQDEGAILSALAFLNEGICRVADIYHSELSNGDPAEHSDLDTLDSLIRGIKTICLRHGLPID